MFALRLLTHGLVVGEVSASVERFFYQRRHSPSRAVHACACLCMHHARCPCHLRTLSLSLLSHGSRLRHVVTSVTPRDVHNILETQKFAIGNATSQVSTKKAQEGLSTPLYSKFGFPQKRRHRPPARPRNTRVPAAAHHEPRRRCVHARTPSRRATACCPRRRCPATLSASCHASASRTHRPRSPSTHTTPVWATCL